VKESKLRHAITHKKKPSYNTQAFEVKTLI